MYTEDAIRQAKDILAESNMEELCLDALKGKYGPRLTKREFAELVDELVNDSIHNS